MVIFVFGIGVFASFIVRGLDFRVSTANNSRQDKYIKNMFSHIYDDVFSILQLKNSAKLRHAEIEEKGSKKGKKDM